MQKPPPRKNVQKPPPGKNVQKPPPGKNAPKPPPGKKPVLTGEKWKPPNGKSQGQMGKTGKNRF